jgi:hypothetical protein
LIGSLVQGFWGGSSPWQYEIIYINRAKLLVRSEGIATSAEMAEVSYQVDYYIHVDTAEAALRPITHMPFSGTVIDTAEIAAYAGPAIEQAINQVVQVTKLEAINEHIGELREVVKEHLASFLAMDQIAINLFYGWGYNFYRLENQLRADDLLIREKACWLLGLSRTMIEAVQSSYRRKHLPPPSRAKPLPDPDAVATAQALEAMSAGIGQLEGTIRALPVPENDRMTQRYRQEAQTLMTLGACDQRLVGWAELLRQSLEGRDADWILANLAEIQNAINLMMSQVRERTSLLK